MLASYAAVYYRIYISPYCPKGPLEACAPDNVAALQAHTGFGFTVAALVILRLVWRWMNPVPEAPPGTRLQQLAAHYSHYAMYFLLITLPLTGWIGVMGNASFFGLFKVTGFVNTPLFDIIVTNWLGMTFEEFEAPFDWFHKVVGGTWLFWTLFAAHVGAGIYHHVGMRDRVLVRMLPKGWIAEPGQETD